MKRANTKAKTAKSPRRKKLLQIPIDKQLHHEFKVYSLMRNTTMTEFVTKAIRDEVARTASGGMLSMPSTIRRGVLRRLTKNPNREKGESDMDKTDKFVEQ